MIKQANNHLFAFFESKIRWFERSVGKKSILDCTLPTRSMGRQYLPELMLNLCYQHLKVEMRGMIQSKDGSFDNGFTNEKEMWLYLHLLMCLQTFPPYEILGGYISKLCRLFKEDDFLSGTYYEQLDFIQELYSDYIAEIEDLAFSAIRNSPDSLEMIKSEHRFTITNLTRLYGVGKDSSAYLKEQVIDLGNQLKRDEFKVNKSIIISPYLITSFKFHSKYLNIDLWANILPRIIIDELYLDIGYQATRTNMNNYEFETLIEFLKIKERNFKFELDRHHTHSGLQHHKCANIIHQSVRDEAPILKALYSNCKPTKLLKIIFLDLIAIKAIDVRIPPDLETTDFPEHPKLADELCFIKDSFRINELLKLRSNEDILKTISDQDFMLKSLLKSQIEEAYHSWLQTTEARSKRTNANGIIAKCVFTEAILSDEVNDNDFVIRLNDSPESVRFLMKWDDQRQGYNISHIIDEIWTFVCE
jgi:hypothetical protein